MKTKRCRSLSMYAMIAYMEKEKRCTKCGSLKALDKFNNSKKSKDGKTSWCKQCAIDDWKQRYNKKKKADPEFAHNRYLKYFVPAELRRHKRRAYVYGKDEKAVKALLAKQGGVCAICEEPIDDGKEVVDHSHKNGKTRGILHHRCNMALGMLFESSKLCRRAANYLARNGD